MHFASRKNIVPAILAATFRLPAAAGRSALHAREVADAHVRCKMYLSISTKTTPLCT